MRREFSKATKTAALERSGGVCECGCGVPFGVEGVEYDHDLPDWLGGDNSLENCKALRVKCHRRKTPKDRQMIDKARRGSETRHGLRESRWRPMPGTRRSGIRKRMGKAAERW